MSAVIARAGIVVGVDGSPASDAAVWWAGREAALRGAVLHIVHVLTTAEMAWPSMSAPVNLIQWQREEASTVIADAIAIAQDSSGAPGALQISSEVVFSRTVPTLVQIAEHAQMVVVGCRGRGAFERRLLGSVSLGLVHHARCPIAVIHDEGPTIRTPGQAPVLLGTDRSPASQSATTLAFAEASHRGVELVVLNAWTDVGAEALPDVDWPALQSVEDKILADHLTDWQRQYPDVAVRRELVFDQPARRLVEHADAAQLVVVGAHGRGGFAGMLLGSVSEAVVQAARIPVIVARQH